jgi:transcriptional regulator with XRE-family HTH domain
VTDLRRRFGQLLAAHRRRRGWTQEKLAEEAGLSPDTIAKVETGQTGARFPVIERLAQALDVDPAEFFTNEFAAGKLRRGSMMELSNRLAAMSDAEILWITGIIDAALAPMGPSQSTGSPRRTIGTRRRRST